MIQTDQQKELDVKTTAYYLDIRVETADSFDSPEIRLVPADAVFLVALEKILKGLEDCQQDRVESPYLAGVQQGILDACSTIRERSGLGPSENDHIGDATEKVEERIEDDKEKESDNGGAL